tara:strand:- start:362 stop:1450 length:1089 start_codon:yes stop_codon:yes gene_type:complete
MVLQARNTNEALNIIAEEVVDAIIIDTNYIDEPCMNLLTLLKQDKTLVHVPKIALFDESNEIEKDDFYKHGAIDCIHKANLTSSCIHRSISVGIDKTLLSAKIDKTTEQLSQMARNAEKSNTQLVKSIKKKSKQVKTTLSITRETLDMLQNHLKEDISKADSEMMDICIGSVDKISTLLDELMDVAYTNNSGNHPVTRKRLNTNELVQDAISNIVYAAEKKDIKIIQRCEHNIPPILGDRYQLHKVLTTIMLNAIKHTDSNGTLKISIQKENPLSTHLLIHFTDSGNGIHPNFLDHIFEDMITPVEMIGFSNFDRLDIGLHACEEIVDAHDGEIIVESSLGKGSKFTVSLPIYNAENIKEQK